MSIISKLAFFGGLRRVQNEAQALSTTTLHLKEFLVRDSIHDMSFHVSVALTASVLDMEGFVTDNATFMNRVRSSLFSRSVSLEKRADYITSVAHNLLGTRLIAVSGSIQELQGTKKKFSFHSCHPSMESDMGIVAPVRPSYGFKDRYIRAYLVNNSICGGHGQNSFICDLSITPDDSNVNDSMKRNYVVHHGVSSEFESKGYLKASCEELAQGLVVAGFMYDPSAVTITGTVYNKTGCVEVVWNQGMKLPPFPREATQKEIDATEGARPRSTYC